MGAAILGLVVMVGYGVMGATRLGSIVMDIWYLPLTIPTLTTTVPNYPYPYPNYPTPNYHYPKYPYP